ncbi:MAG: hypothetical protein KTR30_11585 [Saprospiraceae bacterium]|nr:hypothetical protein [Saprospiraceae bacterium]
MIWAELARIALIGTDQTAIPENIMDLLAARGMDTSSSADQLLLDSAAVFNQMRKAGLIIPTHQGNPPPKIDIPETSKICSYRVIRMLRKILDGTHPYALNEFLSHMVRQDKQLPPEFLPEIFEASLKDAGMWEVLSDRLDERARWLIQLNPEWHGLASASDGMDWYNIGPRGKKILFDHLHKSEPEQAIALLETEWSLLDYKIKLEFLEELAKSLTQSDEAFLNDLKKDKRKEVRLKARDLLANLPGSSFAQALSDLIKPFFQVHEKLVVSIHLPDELPTAAEDYGIDLTKAKKKFASGVKASWVAAVVSRISPSFWEDYLSAKPRNIIAAFYESHLGDVLGQALVLAIIRHQNAEWAEQLVRHEMGRGLPNTWQYAELLQLTKLLTPTTFNDITYYYLQYNGSMLEEENHIVTRMLLLREFPWEERLSRLVIEGFRQWMAETQTFFWNLLHYQRILESAAYNVPPSLVDPFGRDWPYHSPVWPRWEAAVQRFLKTLSFRKDMITALQEK